MASVYNLKGTSLRYFKIGLGNNFTLDANSLTDPRNLYLPDSNIDLRSGSVGQVLAQLTSTSIGWTTNTSVSTTSEAVRILCHNQTGSTMTKGSAIYFSGATGDKPNMTLAQANSESSSAGTVGILTETTTNGSDGYVYVAGTVTNIDTSAFSAGDIVYLSPTVAGGLTSTKPSAPNHLVEIGIITKSNSSTGSLALNVANAYELDELHNVSIPTTPSNNQALVYETSSSLWKAKTLTTSFLSDFSISSPTSGQALAWNGSAWANTSLSSTNLSDFDISSPSSNQILMYLSGKWRNQTISVWNNATSVGNLNTLSAKSYFGSVSGDVDIEFVRNSQVYLKFTKVDSELVLDVSSKRIRSVSNAIDANDAVNKSQLDTKADSSALTDYFKKDGSVNATGNFNLGSNKITNLGTPTANSSDAATTSYVDSKVSNDISVSGTDIDWSLGTTFYKSVNSNTTFTFSNTANGKSIIFFVTNTSTTNLVTITLPTVTSAGNGLNKIIPPGFTFSYEFTKSNNVTYGVGPNAIENLPQNIAIDPANNYIFSRYASIFYGATGGGTNFAIVDMVDGASFDVAITNSTVIPNTAITFTGVTFGLGVGNTVAIGETLFVRIIKVNGSMVAVSSTTV